MIRYDLRSGILNRRWWLILPLSFWSAALIYIAVPAGHSGSMTLGTGLFYIFAGTMPVDISMRSFNIPAIWTLLQLGSVLFTIEYATRDLSRFGQQVLMRCGRRTAWWLSKCLWCCLSTLIYWGIGYLLIALFCLWKGIPLTLEVCGDVPLGSLEACDSAAGCYTPEQMLLPLVAAPVLSATVINMMQMLVAFALNEILAIAFSVIYIVWSMCQQSYLAAGNYSLMQRCSIFYSKGVDFGLGIIVLMLLLLVVIVSGVIQINRMDILEPNKNS